MKRLTILLVLAATGAAAGVVYARVVRPVPVIRALELAQRERVFAPRTSFATEYRPCTAETLFADSVVQREDCGEPRDAFREVARFGAGAESQDPDSLRVSALSDVIWWDGKPASLDAAIERLSYARTLTRDQVPLLVDLSALHLIRAERMQDARDLVKGLDYALEALELEPGNHLALFNAALAAQAFSLKEEALGLWDLYLAVDSASPWAGDARRRRDLLLATDTMPAAPGASATRAEVEAFARRHPQQARELGLATVLGEWGHAVLQGKSARADSLLARADWLGTALKSQGSDQSLADAVASIRTTQGNPATTRRLARAHHAYGRADVLYSEGHDAQAADKFAEVRLLSPPSHALMGWARTYHAVALIVTGNLDQARSELRSLVADTDSVRHPALSARVHWSLGHVLADSGKPHMNRAARTYARLREWESYGGVRYRAAWAMHQYGNAAAAYDISAETLRKLRPYRASAQLHRTLLQTAELASKDGMHRAALLIQAEDNRVVMRVPDPMDRVQALMAHARMLALADSTQRALQTVATASSLRPTLPESTQVKYSEAALTYSAALASAAERTGDPAALDAAVSYFREKEEFAWLITILSHRARLRLAAGDLTGADADLDSLTAYSRGLPSRGFDVHLRAAVVERLRGRYDQLVMGYVRAGQPLRALQALERSRLSFTSSASRRATAGWTAPQFGSVVLEYALVGDTLLTWVIRRDSITLREQRLNPDERRTIAAVGGALESGRRDEAATPGLRRLYDVLIRPVRDRIPPTAGRETELVIVADGELAGVPFAALMDAGRYLVEDHPIRFAAALADGVRVANHAPLDGPALLVANPDFDQYAHAELDRLPGAVAEVSALGRVYGDTILLAGGHATVPAFERVAGRARVIHFAGHAVFDDSRPEQSFLLLAGSGTTGRLTANSVNTMSLDSVRLVVLSACRTVRGRGGRSGGFAGLSGAMLQAGAEGVVGSLWRVNDARVQPLMLAFHSKYREQRDPARALRDAQLQMIQSDSAGLRSPSAWAGFRYVGR